MSGVSSRIRTLTYFSVYVISFLSAFNSRKALRERLEEESYTLPIPVSTINFRRPRGHSTGLTDIASALSRDEGTSTVD